MSRLDWLFHPRETSHRAWKHLCGWGREALRLIGAYRVRLAVLVILVAAVGAGVWSLIHFWDWLRADQVNGVVGRESGSTTVRNIGFVVAGLIALPFAFWRSWVAERQANTAQQHLLNERYQQGAEMLGSEVLSVRLGGIYALERLAAEHPEQYHIQIMQLFCAFVRHPTVDEREKQEQRALEAASASKDLPSSVQARADVQAVMTAIGTRDKTRINIERASKYTLNLSLADLRGAHLADADLSHARFYGVVLSDAFLVDANLSSAFLMESNLSRATMWGTVMSDSILYDAVLSGTDFSQTTFTPGPNRGPEGMDPVVGLTQTQIDHARAELNNPPRLLDVVDATTGKKLVWRGKTLDGQT